MVRSIDPRRVTLRQFQWPSQAAALLGTHTAETILASGHVRPHRKAGHMEASDPIKFSVQPLQEGAVHIWSWNLATFRSAAFLSRMALRTAMTSLKMLLMFTPVRPLA